MENNKIAGLEVERLREIALERFNKDDYKHLQKVAVMVSSSHCAKISYNNHGTGIDYKKDIRLHDTLLESGHYSPFEHCARSMSTSEYYGHHLSQGNNDPFDENGRDYYGVSGNFRGFIQYRQML